MPTNAEWMARGQKVLLANYKPQPITLVRGQGCHVWDADGTRYLDMIGGIAVTALGHNHPRIKAAVQAQLDRLWHTANIVWNEPSIELAEKLVANTFADRAFFCNSGAEANEAQLKLARRWQRERGQDRFEIIAFHTSFHGRTLFTVTATGQPKYWKGFEPMVPGVLHATFNDLASVEKLVGPKTAAILVEPVQGEGGVLPADKAFLQGLRKLADDVGALLLFDEVQTGMGRTGTMLAHEQFGVAPDACSLAKALGNGLPIGAMLCTEKVAGALVPGTHASTFGGNPLACAAAAAVVDELTTGGVLERAKIAGDYLEARLADMARRLGDRVVTTRGMGLLRGVVLPIDAAPIVTKCREAGLLVNAAGEKTVRFAPPLIVDHVQLDEAVAILEGVLKA